MVVFATLALVLAVLLTAGPAGAGDAVVEAARLTAQADGRFRIDVTVRHADTGWDHYADAWSVTGPGGEPVYGTRTLLHPHVNEQPFTRSLSGVALPDGVTQVFVIAHDSVHGPGPSAGPFPVPGR